MASGSPSSRRQISSTAAGSSAARKPGRTDAPRSANNWCAGAGRSGSSGRTTSPGTPSGSRLVAITVSPGQCRTSSSANSAAAATTCSQLSRTSSRLRCAQWSTIRAAGSPCSPAVRASMAGEKTVVSRRPSADSTAPGTASGASSGASSATHTPSGWSPASAAASSSESRVFPDPPGPVSVISRCPRTATSARREASSASRPTNESSRARRFPRRGTARTATAPAAAPPSPALAASNRACSDRSSGPGSAPSRSTRARRVSSYAASASAPRPASCRARISWARNGSSSGWSAISCRSSGSTSSARPSARSASSRRCSAASRSASGPRAAATPSGRSASAGPRHRPSAARNVSAAAGASPSRSARVPDSTSRSNWCRSTSSGSVTRRYAPGSDSTAALPSARRNRPTSACNAAGASCGGASTAQTSPISTSTFTARPPRRASAASSARTRGPPRGTAPCSPSASVTPRIRYFTPPCSRPTKSPITSPYLVLPRQRRPCFRRARLTPRKGRPHAVREEAGLRGGYSDVKRSSPSTHPGDPTPSQNGTARPPRQFHVKPRPPASRRRRTSHAAAADDVGRTGNRLRRLKPVARNHSPATAR